MLIRRATKNDLNDLAGIFSRAFNKASEEIWTPKTAREYLKYCFERRPDLFFAAVEKSSIVGGILGEIFPLWEGPVLAEVEIFIDPKYQNKGTGKLLFRKIVEEAERKYKIKSVKFIADSSKNFPMSWYEKIGMEKTCWVFMEGDAEKVLENLKR